MPVMPGAAGARTVFALNCAALPRICRKRTLRLCCGYLTGALRGGKPGLLNWPTVAPCFLDEIGEMSPYRTGKAVAFPQRWQFSARRRRSRSA